MYHIVETNAGNETSRILRKLKNGLKVSGIAQTFTVKKPGC
jgi:hypothetical protein